MSFDLSLPTTDGALNVVIGVGGVLYVLGANGVGKSSLVQRFYSAHRGKARRISAHRQTWLESNAITLSPQAKKTTEASMLNYDKQLTSRWKDDYGAHRTSITIFELVDAENVRSREITAAVDLSCRDIHVQRPIQIPHEGERLRIIYQ